ncbi:MAG: hypothetical protein JKY23_04410 [Nitrospinaceae bacterium]|nr:hypothetical protein [Nitrospinaceae bacterium]
MVALIPLMLFIGVLTGAGFVVVSRVPPSIGQIGTPAMFPKNSTLIWETLLSIGCDVTDPPHTGLYAAGPPHTAPQITIRANAHDVVQFGGPSGVQILALGPRTGQLQFQSAQAENGSAFLTLRAPTTHVDDVVLTLPSNAAHPGYVLVNDGTGNTYWADPLLLFTPVATEAPTTAPATTVPTTVPTQTGLPTNAPAPGPAPTCDCTSLSDGTDDTRVSTLATGDIEATAARNIVVRAQQSISTISAMSTVFIKSNMSLTLTSSEGMVWASAPRSTLRLDGADVHILGSASHVTIEAPFGHVKIQGLEYPSRDGTKNEVLTTNGKHKLSWSKTFTEALFVTTISGTVGMSPAVLMCELLKIRSTVFMDCQQVTFDVDPLPQPSLDTMDKLPEGFRPDARSVPHLSWMHAYTGEQGRGFVEVHPGGTLKFWRDDTSGWAGGATNCTLYRGSASWTI